MCTCMCKRPRLIAGIHEVQTDKHTKIRCIYIYIYMCDHAGVRVTIYYKRFHQYIVLRKRRLINPALHCSLLFSVPHMFHSAVCVVYLARGIGVVHLRVVQVGSQFLGLLPLLAVLDHRHRCQPDPDLYQLVLVLWTLCSLACHRILHTA